VCRGGFIGLLGSRYGYTQYFAPKERHYAKGDMVSCKAVVTIVLLVSFSWTAHGVSEAVHLTHSIDLLCKQTGLSRAGQVKLLRRTEYADVKYRVEVALTVEANLRLYTILLDHALNVVEFRPEGWPSVPGGLIKYPPGYDTYKNPQGRQLALAAVNRFNRIRNYKTHGKPAIQKVGSDVLITYRWTSRKRRDSSVLYEDAALSFIVTPHGTVCGQLWGFWPTNGRWPLLPLPAYPSH
jgi:hypothetical protein